jgi:hypothetical protein
MFTPEVLLLIAMKLDLKQVLEAIIQAIFPSHARSLI